MSLLRHCCRAVPYRSLLRRPCKSATARRDRCRCWDRAPLLSRQLRAGEDHNAMGSMNRAMEFALLLTVPAAAALMVIPDGIIAVLFERGAFGAAETDATAWALAYAMACLPTC